LYRFLRGVGRTIYFFRRWQVFGRQYLPATGGAIIAANHNSAWDPILLGCAIDREIHYMGKEEIFHKPIGAWFFSSLHAFPVKRGSVDRRAIRRALDILKAGQLVGIFPEGTRVESGKKVEPQAGIALLALKAQVPVVPVGLKGSRSGGPPQIIIGNPMHFDDYYEAKPNSALLESISKQIMQEVNRLVEELTSGTGGE